MCQLTTIAGQNRIVLASLLAANPKAQVRNHASYLVYWTGAQPFRLRYGCIEGSLIVSSNAMIYAANLRHVGGHFITSSNLRIHLPCLASVAGNFEAMQSFHVAAPVLRRVGGNVMLAGCLPPSLETVAGRLGIYWADSVYAPWLRHVGCCLVISKANEARFPLLETVNGGVLMTHPAKKIDVPGLRIVGGDFLAGEVTDIRAPRLEAVIGHLDTSFAKEFYHLWAAEIGRFARGQWNIGL